MPAKHLSNRFAPADRRGNFRARRDQRLDRPGVVARLAVPSIFRAVNRPAQRRAVEIGVPWLPAADR